jgi:hypothetical protein
VDSCVFNWHADVCQRTHPVSRPTGRCVILASFFCRSCDVATPHDCPNQASFAGLDRDRVFARPGAAFALPCGGWCWSAYGWRRRAPFYFAVGTATSGALGMAPFMGVNTLGLATTRAVVAVDRPAGQLGASS